METLLLTCGVVTSPHACWCSVCGFCKRQMHQQVKLDGMDLDELYDVEPIERTGANTFLFMCLRSYTRLTCLCGHLVLNHCDVWCYCSEKAPAVESQSLDVTCLRCKRQVCSTITVCL